MAHTSATYLQSIHNPTGVQTPKRKKKSSSRFVRSQIEISSPSEAGDPLPLRRPRRRADGVGVVLPALRRQPLGGGDLGRHGGALRGHLLAPHLPHRHLQLPPRHHRAPLPQARRHEGRILQLLLRRRRRLRILLPARGLLLFAREEDGPRRDQPQGRLAGALLRQAQVRRRRGRRALRRLRPAQLPLRGPRRRQAALRARAARPADEPPRDPRERPHRLLHGLPLLPLLHQHPYQPAEAVRLRAAPRGGRGRRGTVPHARYESKLSLNIHLGWC